jgi:predicted O-methyltransferase YrrM
MEYDLKPKPLPKISEKEPKNYIHWGKLISDLAQFIRAKVIVEIGVQYGRSSKQLVLAAARMDGQYIGYDLFKKAKKGPYSKSSYGSKATTQRIVRVSLRKNGFDPETVKWKLHKTNTLSETFASKLDHHLGGKKIDLAFIDGCHSYDGALSDYKNISKHMSRTGVIVFHDTYSHVGLRKLTLDLRTKFHDGTYDVVDFPFGGHGRVGLTLVVKRSFATTGSGITNFDHDPDISAEDIYLQEKSYLEKEKK